MIGGTVVRAACRLAVATGVTAWLRARRDAAAVFSYHNVVPDGPVRGERPLHVPLTRFQAQLECLTAGYDVVPLAELLQRHGSGRPLRGLAAVTFDDGYRGVLRHALPVLGRLACPATIFVVSETLDHAAPYWWDQLADAAGGEVPDREHHLTELAGDGSRILATYRSESPNAWDDDYLPATQAELAALDPALIAIGLHTMTHPNLTRVSSARCRDELRGCWRTLRERFVGVFPVVAYPYGAVDARVAQMAAALGLTGLTLSGRCVRHGAAAACIPRIFVGPNMTADMLEMTVAGLRVRR